ncbi:Bacteriophage Mu Gam like protein [Peptoniphilus sp. ING2-D1G]|nr:Bacteriophage Mu Gam like protein [Peptoniphilus sp. ING2-D1G]
MDNLALIEDLTNEEVTERESFKVTDMASADWCFRKISAIKKDIAEKERYADLEIEKYVAFKDKEKKAADDSIAFFESLLIAYYEEQKAIDDKFKLKTAQGSLSARKTKSYKYDDDKVIAFLKENGIDGYIKTEEKLKKQELKTDFKAINGSLVTENGEIIDGVVIEDVTSYTIKGV